MFVSSKIGEGPTSQSRRRVYAVSVFFVVQAVFYLGYSVWRTVIDPLEFYRVPGLEIMAYGFLLLMFVAGVFFLTRASVMLIGLTGLRSTDLYASVCSAPLWFFPALVSMGNAHYYLTKPYMPAALRPYGFYYLTNGAIFVVVGMVNILCTLLILLGRRTNRKPVSV